MPTPIERVMQAYGLMVTLTAEEEKAARERLEYFLKNRDGNNQELTVQGLQFLRGNPTTQNRRGRKRAA